jgi:hypothetical protein
MCFPRCAYGCGESGRLPHQHILSLFKSKGCTLFLRLPKNLISQDMLGRGQLYLRGVMSWPIARYRAVKSWITSPGRQEVKHF